MHSAYSFKNSNVHKEYHFEIGMAYKLNGWLSCVMLHEFDVGVIKLKFNAVSKMRND